MKKRWRMMTALVLAMLLLFPVQAGKEIRSESEETMDAFQGRLPFYIVAPVEYSQIKAWDLEGCAAYMSQFQKEIGLESNPTVLAADYIYHMAKKGLWHGYGESGRAPLRLLAVWLSEEEKARVEACEQVIEVVAMTGEKLFRPFIIAKFSAAAALRVLQFSVGLSLYDGNIDINQDGTADASDALLILQNSVGLIVFARPNYFDKMTLMAPSPTYITQWEAERTPKDTWMYAPDLNGDGRVDEVDILIKHGDRWR